MVDEKEKTMYYHRRVSEFGFSRNTMYDHSLVGYKYVTTVILVGHNRTLCAHPRLCVTWWTKGNKLVSPSRPFSC